MDISADRLERVWPFKLMSRESFPWFHHSRLSYRSEIRAFILEIQCYHTWNVLRCPGHLVSWDPCVFPPWGPTLGASWDTCIPTRVTSWNILETLVYIYSVFGDPGDILVCDTYYLGCLEISRILRNVWKKGILGQLWVTYGNTGHVWA